jgi:hypothetical protein
MLISVVAQSGGYRGQISMFDDATDAASQAFLHLSARG